MGTMCYFGERWNMPALDDAEQVPAPVHDSCIWCAEPIVEGEQGVTIPFVFREEDGGVGTKRIPYHRECWTRSVVGNIAHLEGRDMCARSGQVGGHAEQADPSPREEARATVAWLEAYAREAVARLKDS